MDITMLEELQYNAFPPLQTRLYDGWTLRFGGNFTYRVNCANPIYPGAQPPETVLEQIEAAYEASGLRGCIVKLHQGMGEQAAVYDRLLADRGYQEDRRGNIFCCGLGRFSHAYQNQVDIQHRVEAAWLKDFLDMNGTSDPGERAAAERMLQNIALPVLAASIQLEGRTVACGLGVCERGYVGLYDIFVDSAFRRRGLGADLCAGIMDAGKAQGCHTAYLQVLQNNTGARALYRGLGYAQDYEYWFRLKWY